MTCRRLRFDLQERYGAKVLLISGPICSVNACIQVCLLNHESPGESKKDSVLPFC